MPCVNSSNGKPVPGIQGQCPIGSTWVEDGQATVSEPSNNKLFRDSKIFGNWFDPKNYTDLKNWSENLQGYIDERPTLSKIDNSMNEFFTKMGFNKSATKNDGLTEQQKLLMAGGSDSGRRGRATLNPQHKSRHGGEFKPTMMKKLTNNMKNPEWWSESISGLPSDTRLMRLGQLMNYYGKTPKGRQASDDPSKLWAANEAASAKIQAAKDASTAKSAVELYGKKTIADLTTELIPDVKEMFGDRRWTRITDNPEEGDEKAMASIAGQVATNIKAMSLAFTNKTPGDIRKMALAKTAKDLGLDVY